MELKEKAASFLVLGYGLPVALPHRKRTNPTELWTSVGVLIRSGDEKG